MMVTDRKELDQQLTASSPTRVRSRRRPGCTPSPATQLREVLAADHRYVFALIHKFRLDKAAGEETMAVQ